jgi:hypothetical protein
VFLEEKKPKKGKMVFHHVDQTLLVHSTWASWVVMCYKKLIKGRSLCYMCTLCIGSILVGKKKLSYPILSTMNLK